MRIEDSVKMVPGRGLLCCRFAVVSPFLVSFHFFFELDSGSLFLCSDYVKLMLIHCNPCLADNPGLRPLSLRVEWIEQ